MRPGDIINIGADPTIMKRAEWKKYRHLSFTLFMAHRNVPIEMPSTEAKSDDNNKDNEDGDKGDVAETNGSNIALSRNPTTANSQEPNGNQEIASTSYSTLNDVSRESASLNRLITELDSHDIHPMIQSNSHLQEAQCSMNPEHEECDPMYSPESSTQLALNKSILKCVNTAPMNESFTQKYNQAIQPKFSFAPSVSLQPNISAGTSQGIEEHAHSVKHYNQSAKSNPPPHRIIQPAMQPAMQPATRNNNAQKRKLGSEKNEESSTAFPSAGPSSAKMATCRAMFVDRVPIETTVSNIQAANAIPFSAESSTRIIESKCDNKRDELLSALLFLNADDLQQKRTSLFRDLRPMLQSYDNWEQYKKYFY